MDENKVLGKANKKLITAPGERNQKRPLIKDMVIKMLWAKSAGRCEFEGCGECLYEDSLTTFNGNFANVAHIVSWTPTGPRGRQDYWGESTSEESNLMLMCNKHHHLVDIDKVDDYSEERLRKMKKEFEDDIQMKIGVPSNRKTIVVTYTAKIGNNLPVINNNAISSALIANSKYPDQKSSIDIKGSDTYVKDNQRLYWENEDQNIIGAYNERIKGRSSSNGTTHYSIFAYAPMPLLVRLGTLLSDIKEVDVYQLHREPGTWEWINDDDIQYHLIEPCDKTREPALVFALSAKAIVDRVKKDAQHCEKSIWTITVDNPHNDIITSKRQLTSFRRVVREVLDKIHTTSKHKIIHVFMAMPMSCAVELGRCWMPKADLSLWLYDYNSVNDQDTLTIKIENKQ